MDLIFLLFCLFLYFKGNKSFSITGFLALSTNYFRLGSKHDSLFFKHDVQYSAILFVIIVFSVEFYKHNKFRYAKKEVKKLLKIFTLFLLISISVDILSNGTSIFDVFTSLKTWLLLLSFYIFSRLKLEELHRILMLICIITSIHVFIFYFQYFTGIVIVDTKIIEQDFSSGNYTRMGYPPYYTYLLILILLSDIFKLKPIFKYLVLLLAFATSLVSLTRSMTAAFIIGILTCNFLKTPSSLFKYLLVGVILLFMTPIIVSNFPILTERFGEGYSDFSNSFANIDASSQEGTFHYRLLHMIERVVYISEDFTRSIFGVGFVHEKNYTADPFTFGIYKEEYNAISQLGTADISWSGLFLRLGFVGVAIYLLFFRYFIKLFYSFKNFPVARVGFAYIFISLFILSFSSSRIAFGTFWPLIFIFYYYLQKQLIINKTTQH